MRKLLNLARTDTRCTGHISGNADHIVADHQSRQIETEQLLFRQSYVFHTIPKRPGVEPYLKAETDGGLCLFEGFRIQPFPVPAAVILLFTVYGLILGVHFLYVAGLQGLELHLRLFWVSCWITGLSTLIIALLLRQPNSACLVLFGVSGRRTSEAIWTLCVYGIEKTQTFGSFTPELSSTKQSTGQIHEATKYILFIRHIALLKLGA